MEPEYIYSKKDTDWANRKINAVKNEIISDEINSSDYGKITNVYRVLLENVKYVNDGKYTRHTLIGPFIEKKAVCDGFAKAYKFLMDALNVPCKIMYGYCIDKGKKVPHAWNRVLMDEVWYNVDLTCGRLLATDKMIEKDHIWDDNEENGNEG